MNLFARGLGGYFSDLANAKLGMQGRIIVHTLYLLAEGMILVIFSRVDSIAHAIITLVLFSCCVQAAEGTTYAIVPYVAPKALGSVSGVVRAGGNVGAGGQGRGDLNFRFWLTLYILPCRPAPACPLHSSCSVHIYEPGPCIR